LPYSFVFMYIAKVWLLRRVLEENREYVSGMWEIPKSPPNKAIE